MPELTIPDVPPRLINELREWATLRRSTVEAAAIEMIRIGLHQTRDRDREMSALIDSADHGTRH